MKQLLFSRMVQQEEFQEKSTMQEKLKRVFNDKISDEFSVRSRRFNEHITFCEKIIEFHKKQFTKTIESEVTIENVPDHMLKLLEEGLIGMRAYEKTINNLKILHTSFTQTHQASTQTTKTVEKKVSIAEG